LKALITGGGGFIGRHLVDKLISLNYEVIVIDSEFTGDLTKVNPKARLIESNIETFSVPMWTELIEGVDYVFHLAAQKHNTKNITNSEIVQTNVNATINLSEACGLSEVNKLVFTSSLYAYGNTGPNVMKETDLPQPNTIYGASKLMGENILQTFEKKLNLQWNVARLFFIYGPGQFAGNGYKSVIVNNFERMLQRKPPVINGSGNQALDYVYVEDAVEAIYQLAITDSNSKIVNVSSREPVSINQLTDLMIKVSGNTCKPIFSEKDWTEGTIRYGDNTKINELINWPRKVQLEEGLTRTWISLGQAN
jgi:UDP-glucose 4-epimerase